DTLTVSQTGPTNLGSSKLVVTLNGQSSTFKPSQVTQIQAQLLAGNDVVSMSGIGASTVTTVDGGAGSDTFTGNFGTAATIAGNMTLKNFESASVTIGTLSGQLTVLNGPLANSSFGTVSGSLNVPEAHDGQGNPIPGTGVISNTTIGTITSTGSVSTGSIS